MADDYTIIDALLEALRDKDILGPDGIKSIAIHLPGRIKAVNPDMPTVQDAIRDVFLPEIYRAFTAETPEQDAAAAEYLETIASDETRAKKDEIKKQLNADHMEGKRLRTTYLDALREYDQRVNARQIKRGTLPSKINLPTSKAIDALFRATPGTPQDIALNDQGQISTLTMMLDQGAQAVNVSLSERQRKIIVFCTAFHCSGRCDFTAAELYTAMTGQKKPNQRQLDELVKDILDMAPVMVTYDNSAARGYAGIRDRYTGYLLPCEIQDSIYNHGYTQHTVHMLSIPCLFAFARDLRQYTTYNIAAAQTTLDSGNIRLNRLLTERIARARRTADLYRQRRQRIPQQTITYDYLAQETNTTSNNMSRLRTATEKELTRLVDLGELKGYTRSGDNKKIILRV